MAQFCDKFMHPFRSVDSQRFFPPVERERLHKAEDTKKMVCMPVSDENGVHGKSGPRPHHLLLGTFPAVKKDRVRPSPDHKAGGVPLRGRKGPGSTRGNIPAMSPRLYKPPLVYNKALLSFFG